MLQPDFKEFSRLARESTLVPVVKSVSADLLTPVSAFLAICAEGIARFSAGIGRTRRANRTLHLPRRSALHAGQSSGREGRNRPRPPPRSLDRQRLPGGEAPLREHRPATVPGLPPFTAGAVGYFAYDVVRQLENIGDLAKDDLSMPDAELMFFDRLLAFDHLRHQIHIMAAADVSR